MFEKGHHPITLKPLLYSIHFIVTKVRNPVGLLGNSAKFEVLVPRAKIVCGSPINGKSPNKVPYKSYKFIFLLKCGGFCKLKCSEKTTFGMKICYSSLIENFFWVISYFDLISIWEEILPLSFIFYLFPFPFNSVKRGKSHKQPKSPTKFLSKSLKSSWSSGHYDSVFFLNLKDVEPAMTNSNFIYRKLKCGLVI